MNARINVVRVWLRVAGVTALVLGITGCQTSRQSDESGARGTNWSEPEGERVEAADVKSPIDVSAWKPKQRRYVERDASDALTSMITSNSDGTFRISWGDDRASVVRVEDVGLVLVGTEDAPNDAWTVYDPPVLWLPRERSGFESESLFDVTVYSLKDRERQVDRGSGRQTIADEGDQQIRLGDDENVRCRRVVRTMSLDLGRADVETQTTAWFAVPWGLVAERSEERVKVIGPLGWNKSRSVVLDPSGR